MCRDFEMTLRKQESGHEVLSSLIAIMSSSLLSLFQSNSKKQQWYLNSLNLWMVIQRSESSLDRDSIKRWTCSYEDFGAWAFSCSNMMEKHPPFSVELQESRCPPTNTSSRVTCRGSTGSSYLTREIRDSQWLLLDIKTGCQGFMYFLPISTGIRARKKECCQLITKHINML